MYSSRSATAHTVGITAKPRATQQLLNFVIRIMRYSHKEVQQLESNVSVTNECREYISKKLDIPVVGWS